MTAQSGKNGPLCDRHLHYDLLLIPSAPALPAHARQTVEAWPKAVRDKVRFVDPAAVSRQVEELAAGNPEVFFSLEARVNPVELPPISPVDGFLGPAVFGGGAALH